MQMHEYDIYTKDWENQEEYEEIRKEILSLLKGKASLAQVRTLFHSILRIIEEKNLVNL